MPVRLHCQLLRRPATQCPHQNLDAPNETSISHKAKDSLACVGVEMDSLKVARGRR